ncbi:dehydrodolichyl diphosphate synthase complex subunit NUS1 [Cephus cinctus]|uniref:ditrans,polycis-polyprenyl diphosphate synthase [(2E,6E)-farnesyldiphosphate specific] n=1 Tax=Cephus cinctus TaxID=211228 RepID=A0AAJ7BXP0_CEPCN|nr:dehydrodolichyl diphosphate synthase complex subunit NUS1 [Cephus cinctus]
MTAILRIILALLHLVHTLHRAVIKGWAYMQTAYFKLRHGENNREELDVLFESVIKMEKLPRHLVIVLGREEPSFLDLIRIIGWCVATGISCVSFYDHKGVIRNNESTFWRELTSLRPDLISLIDWTPSCPVKAIQNALNGTKHKTRVQILSYSDGKGEIVSLTQNLSKAVTLGVLKLEEITTEFLDEKLDLGGISHPDVALICGSTYSTYGLLPWHIRTTEFFLLPTHHNVSVKIFVSLLEKFARCEQRYGK